MIVYRIEKDGTGPYGYLSHSQWFELNIAHRDVENHPSFGVDLYGVDGLTDDSLITGCPTLNELLVWFDNWIGFLLDEGFQVYAIEVDDWGVKWGKSKKQVFFNENAIKSKTTIDIVDYIESQPIK
jgi:hypothetical protein